MSITQAAQPDARTDTGIVIVYDGDCPFCQSYVRLMSLRHAVGGVELVDARTSGPVVRKLVERGYDLNEGMVAIYGDRIYYGSDAVTLISSLSDVRGWTGRAVAFLLRGPTRARVLYPMLKLGRRVTLKLLGKPPL